MPKQSQRAEINSFVKGIVTEANPINFPPNATVDEENFDLQIDGTRSRRLGIDLEPGYISRFIPYDGSSPIYSYRWHSVNGLTGRDFVVVQVLNVLYFFDLTFDNLSSQGYVGSLTLSGFPTNVKYSFCALDGKLVAACGVSSIIIITFNGGFTYTADTIKVRDFWGLYEAQQPQYETDIEFRGNNNHYHVYNLRNQSWATPRKDSAGNLRDVLDLFLGNYGVMPSNSETVWTGLQYQAGYYANDTWTAAWERIYPSMYDDARLGSTAASRGHFIIDLLNRGAGRREAYARMYANSPVLNAAYNFYIPDDITYGGATSVAEYAGRVFFAGFNGQRAGGDSRSPNLANQIAFSQLVKSIPDITRCYQEGDPTDRDTHDLVATDGGIIRISGAEQVVSLVSTENSLVVLCTNGVWAITGGNDYGFDATNYKVTQVTTFGCIAPNAVITEGTNIYFLSEGGIYVIGKNQLGDLLAQDITISSIKSMYEAIPISAKRNSIGVFDSYTGKARWLWRVGNRFTETSETYELIFDVALAAFYKYRIGRTASSNVEIFSAFISPVFTLETTVDNVFAGAEQVISTNNGAVIVQGDSRRFDVQSNRYLALVKVGNQYSLGFCYYYDDDFVDWALVDGVGVDAEAWMITGATTAGDTAIPKQVPYLTMYLRRTEEGFDGNNPLKPSSCLVRSMWDFSNSTASNRWSPFYQVYRHRQPQFGVNGDLKINYDIIITKNKIRGRGAAFTFEMRTEPKKDCKIVGWSLTLNGNSVT